MRLRAILIALLATAWASVSAHAQSTILQGGPWQAGHSPMYVGQGYSQAVLQDSGPAGGGGVGVGLSEQLLVVQNPAGVYPAVSAGTGPFGANWCDYDAPITNPTGYHYLCLSPNSSGEAQIIYGAGGGAALQPLYFNINGALTPIGGTSSAITVGSTLIGSGVNGQYLTDNDGVLGLAAPPTGSIYLEFSSYGADPTGATYSDAAYTAWQAAMVSTGYPGHAKAGTYKFQNPVFFNVSGIIGKGLHLYGDGCNTTIFNYVGAYAPAFRLGNDYSNGAYAVSTYGGAASGGSGYDGGGTATYTNVPLTGGSGTGAAGTVVVASGVVSYILMTSYGSGYNVGDQLTASNTNLGGTGSGLVALVRGDNFYSSIQGISFSGSVNGPLVQYGRTDMLDAINAPVTDVCENNNSSGSSAVQMQVNAVLDSAYFSNVTGGPSATNGYAACDIRGAAFVNFYGSCGGMAIGEHITATTSQANFGNIFHAIDVEVTTKGVVYDSVGGASAQKNTHVGGQLAYSSCAIDGQTGYYNLFITANLGGTGDFCGTQGVTAIGPTYLPYTNNVWSTLGLTATSSLIAVPNNNTQSGINFFTNSAANSLLFELLESGVGYIINSSTTGGLIYQVSSAETQSFYAGSTLAGYFDASGLEYLKGLGVGEGVVGAGNIDISGQYQVAGAQIAIGNLASVASKSFVGNSSGSSAAPAALTVPAAQALLGSTTIAFAVSSVNFNSANTDTQFPITLPTGYTRYVLSSVSISGASASLSTSTVAVWTGAGGTGINPVISQNPTVTTASDGTNNNTEYLGVANRTTQSYTVAGYPTLYFRVGTAQGSAATASVGIVIYALP